MPLDPLDVPPGCLSLDAATVIADAINEASSGGQIIADDILIASTVGSIDLNSEQSIVFTSNQAFTFTSGANVTFNLGGNFSLIGSGNVNFDTTNGDPDVTSRINFLSGEGIQFTASQAGAAGFIRFNTTHLNAPNLQVFANNAAAISGGLNVGDLYRTGANPDPVCVVH